jgi:hypothetical protein
MGSTDIQFTEKEIRIVWSRLFASVCPADLRTKSVFEACLMELGSERLREVLWEMRRC